MKILHVGKYYPPAVGGMERFLQDLAEEQVRQGHQVTVFCHQSPGNSKQAKPAMDAVATSEEPEASVGGGLRIHRQPVLGTVLHTPLMRQPRAAFQHLLADFHPDVIHLHWPNPVVLWLLPHLLAAKVPLVLQWHSDTVTNQVSPWVKRAHRLLKKHEDRLLGEVSSVVCSSQAYADHSPILKAYQDKCSVIPLGMDFQRLAQVFPSSACKQWAEDLWPENALRLLSLGRLSFYKNLTKVLEAVALAHQEKRSIHLVIAGEGPEYKELQKRIAALGIAPRVTMTGAVSSEQAAALMDSAAVFVLASNDRAESFGLVLLEALWHGLPLAVAATPGSGMAEVVKKIHSGCLFDPGSAQDMLAAILTAWQLPSTGPRSNGNEFAELMARPWGRALRERLLREFDIAHISRRYSRLYQQLVDEAMKP